ncbi:MAG: 50S ribosomal protein L18 [Chthoniobacterales bacterium]|nr:50S ribosomal protein L18 [Chthoniobacterales bacterium]
MTRHDSIKLRHKRIRKKVAGTAERPRLAVNFSGRHIRAQVIDDTKGVTLAAASTQEQSVGKPGANVANAQAVGRLVAERSKAKSVSKVVFDRGGFQYQGKVKALADAAREAGLDF